MSRTASVAQVDGPDAAAVPGRPEEDSMHVSRIHQFGPPQVLRYEQVDDPEPAAGEVLVAVERAGVSYGDVIVRAGRHPVPLPYVPGVEVGGRVVAVGDGADPALLDRRVVACTVRNAGGYAELARARAGYTFAVPDGLGLDRAVAAFQAGAVALGLLAAMRVRPGDTVLVTAAAGRIGLLLVQLARAAGGTVIAAAGGGPKLAAAREAGAAHAVDYTDPDWPDQVRQVTGGRGAEVVLDAVGGTLGAQAIDAAARPGGRIGIYGFASGTWTPLDTAAIVPAGRSVSGPLSLVFAKPADEQRADAEQALALAAGGQLVPRLHAEYPLADAAAAHTELAARHTIGGVQLLP
ncbi:NADPH:quinone reductase [Actinocatenispora thailandica]|uniref:NADPH:quinone reductase n=1 Tax=Actinocatenispora thailandica TaxID=227318 RepID=A0A7R7DSG8_9ACTN|nr:zinc-binding dehydrogenase [Actinocatenispora thailandica]BCJ36988.1 NADPH:quinone reductase [Actinocatenispora thailandica]